MLNGEKLKGHILILITNILFAINMPISKYLLPSHVQPEALTIMRMGSACLLFWLTSLFIKREKVTIKDLGLRRWMLPSSQQASLSSSCYWQPLS